MTSNWNGIEVVDPIPPDNEHCSHAVECILAMMIMSTVFPCIESYTNENAGTIGNCMQVAVFLLDIPYKPVNDIICF